MSNHAQVAHIWAQQSGKNGNGCNMFSEGKTIYSYGYHFPIASFIDFSTILFTTDSYSVSTSQHISHVRNALPSFVAVYSVPNVKPSSKSEHRENYKSFLKRIEIEAVRLSKARVYTDTGHLFSLIADTNSYSKLFKLGNKEFSADNYQEIIGQAAERAKKDVKKRKKLEKKRLADIKERMVRALPRWLQGETSGIKLMGLSPSQFARHYHTEFLRVKPSDPETVQTSNHAEIPLEHCKRAWPLIKKIVDAGKEFTPNGHTIKIGHFAISHISKAGVIKAGCHTFKFAELERFAKVIGL